MLKARHQNPDIQAARAAWQAKRAEISPAGTWPNPTFTYIDERFPSGVEGVDPEKIHHYRIEQSIPFPGKLSGDARMKYHEVLIAEEEYRVKMLDVFKDVKMRYFQLYLTDQQIDLATQSVEILKNSLASAQARLASSQVSASDVFMAQTELEKAQNDLYEQQQQRLLIQIELNTLLNQATETALGSTRPPPLEDLPASLTDLQTLALHDDPQYLSAAHEINHARAMLKRNRLEFAPDFSVMAERETAPAGPAGRQLGVSISFPLWLWRPWDNYRSAQEHMNETAAASQAMENTVRQNVHHEYVETQTHLTLARNYAAQVVPSALSNLRIAREQYASGQSDFLRLLEAYRLWIQTHNDYNQHVYDYGEHWSALEQWVGLDLSLAKEALDQLKTVPQEMPHGK